MKRVCAWCNKRITTAKGGKKDEISHGICEDCAEYFFRHGGKQDLRELLSKLDAPIVAVNSEGVITIANEKAQETLGKDVEEIEGDRGGQALECAHSRLPGGCGQTVHCKGCAIRRTVMDTLETGNPHHKVEAVLNCSGSPGDRKQKLHISTQMVANIVLLRIDDVRTEAA